METKPCINCGHEGTETYCSNCGQRLTVKRLTFRAGWNDFWARIYGFDGMFPRTLRDLTIRPGHAARLYVQGNRARYYGPVGYFFLMITLLFLVATLLDVDIIKLLKNSGEIKSTGNIKPGTGMEAFMESTYRSVSDNMKLIAFGSILIQAFCARYVFFRGAGMNYIENLVLPFYVQGHIYWLMIVSVVAYAVSGHFLPSAVVMVISFLYVSYSYIDFFSHNSKVKAFIKGMGVYLLAQLIFAVMVAAYVFFLLVTNPEIREMIKPSNNR